MVGKEIMDRGGNGNGGNGGTRTVETRRDDD